MDCRLGKHQHFDSLFTKVESCLLKIYYLLHNIIVLLLGEGKVISKGWLFFSCLLFFFFTFAFFWLLTDFFENV